MKKMLLAVSTLAAVCLTTAASAGVMFQGFYWDTPSGWYSTMNSNASGLRSMAGGQGIERMYFPPPSKAQGGGYSMGYDVDDYYDIGNYNQDGTTATRFGTAAQLRTATTTYRNLGVVTMADIVLNHRSGGASETNPNTGGSTWTNFAGKLSGKCKWHYNEFHPSSVEGYDEGSFGGYPDVCHATGNSAGHAYYDLIQWGNWLKVTTNAGFNGGWRFDYVKGFHPWMAKDFRSSTGNLFCVGEYWDANTSLLDSWTGSTGCSVFDFASYYTLQGICTNTGGGYLPDLLNYSKSYAAKNPYKAVTFAGNHDTDVISSDKMMAYSWMLTYQGYPCIWWKDYFNYGLATAQGQWGNGIKQLVWVRNKLAGGGPAIQILKSNDGDCLSYGTTGGNSTNPGYIMVINDNSSAWKGAAVTTSNAFLKNKTLKCYAWSSTVSGQNYQPASQFCSSAGAVTVYAPPRGYAVYAPDGY